MSILFKKIYIKKGSSTAACNIYSTAAEAGDKALSVRVDGVAGYVALKPITDANATAGRVSIGGVTYAIATKHESGGTVVPYTEKSWTEAGNYSFVVPSGINRLRIALCGGGAGAGAGGAGNTGGDTRAFDLFATGGEGGSAWTYGNGGTPNGYASEGNKVTAGFALSFDKANNGDYGKGGKYGGSGGYDSQYVSVVAGQSYAITVGGAGGAGGTGGFVLVAYGGDI